MDSTLQNNFGLISTLQEGASSDSFTRLSNSDCIRDFRVDYQSAYSAVVIITNGTEQLKNSSSLLIFHIASVLQGDEANGHSYEWMYFNLDTLSYPLPDLDPNSWFLGPKIKAEYCLAKNARTICTFKLLPTLLWTVLGCNLVKAICFLALLFTKFDPLITTGDAVASFLTAPDPTTSGLGALPAIDSRINPYHYIFESDEHKARNIRWSGKRTSWRHAADGQGLYAFTAV